jgi:hypothetical protein
MTLSIPAAGVVRLTSISAKSGEALVRATLGGAYIDFAVRMNRADDGAASSSVSSPQTPPNTNSYAVRAGPTVDLAIPANRTVTVFASSTLTASGNSTTIDMYIEVSFDAGASWSMMGGVVSGIATSGEPVSIDIERSISSSTTGRVARFRLWSRRSGSPVLDNNTYPLQASLD